MGKARITGFDELVEVLRNIKKLTSEEYYNNNNNCAVIVGVTLEEIIEAKKIIEENYAKGAI